MFPLLYSKVDFTKDFSNNEGMKCCLIHEMLICIYAHLVLEVGLRALDNSFHISELYIANFCFFNLLFGKLLGEFHFF